MLTAQVLASAGLQADCTDAPTALQLITVAVVEACATELWDVDIHEQGLCSGIDLVNRQTTLASVTQRQVRECQEHCLRQGESQIPVAEMGREPCGASSPRSG